VLSAALTRQTEDIQRLAALEDSCRQTASDAADVQQRADYIGALVAADADRTRQALINRWNAQRGTARQAARVVLDGPGRLGLRRAAVARATEQLTGWATAWAPHLPDLPTDSHRLAQAAAGPDSRSALCAALDASARRPAEAATLSTPR
jgi:riboflavin biosynthesis pyrimidine reductase